MSYIIAFVKYNNEETAYPVNCFREDVKVGEGVITRRADGEMRPGIVSSIERLNWDCAGSIFCKQKEAEMVAGKFLIPKNHPIQVGTVTVDIIIGELKKYGWTFLSTKRKMYQAVLTKSNSTRTANLFFRRNGLDLQMLEHVPQEKPLHMSLYVGSFQEGRIVRHALAHTKFNLWDGMLRFSKEFSEDVLDLDKYFVPVGSTDKRDDRLKAIPSEKKSYPFSN